MSEENVVFYAWIENQPASLVFRVGGGERRADSQGKIVAEPTVLVRFASGKYRTNDPLTIAELRKAIKKGENITEDEELYLSKVMPVANQKERLEKKSAALASDNKKLLDENNRLKAALERKSAAGDRPSRTKAAAATADNSAPTGA